MSDQVTISGEDWGFAIREDGSVEVSTIGVAGPVGPAGPPGKDGADGAPGKDGFDGAPGPNLVDDLTASSLPDGLLATFDGTVSFVDSYVGLFVDLGNQTMGITDTGVTAGVYGSATKSAVITVGADGRIISASSVTIAGADLTAYAKLGTVQIFTAAQTFRAASKTDSPLIVQAATGQTASVCKLVDASGVAFLSFEGGTATETWVTMNVPAGAGGASGFRLGADGSTRWSFYTAGAASYSFLCLRFGGAEGFEIDTSGRFGIGTRIVSVAPAARLHVHTATASTIGTIIQGSASQTGDLLQLRNNVAAVVAGFSATGRYLTADSEASTGTGTRVRRLPIASAAGVLLGYIPILDG